MPPVKRTKIKRKKIVPTVKLKTWNLQTKTRSIEYIPILPDIKKKTSASYQPDNVLPNFVPDPSSTPTSTKKTYSLKKQQEVQKWETLRTKFLKAYISNEMPYNDPPRCFKCGDEQNQLIRCIDCSMKTLWCTRCLMDVHPIQRLHKLEVFKEGTFFPIEILEMKVLKCNPNSTLHVDMTLIDTQGRTHSDCTIYYEDNLPVDLVSIGFWPVSPTSPTTAVSIPLLMHLQSLTLECQVSLQGFTNAINSDLREKLDRSKLHRITRGECIPEFRIFHQQLQDAPVSLLYPNKWRTDCPACPKDQGPIFAAMDANFGLVHKINAGKTYGRSPMDDMFFVNQDELNQFVTSYFPDTKEQSEDCSNFQAANSIRAKNKTVKLDVKGIFGSACRHEIPLLFCDLLHGERLAYPVYIIEELRKENPTCDLHVLYDIACVLKNHLKKRNNEDLLNAISLAIPIFHSYGHRGECQVTLNPRRLAGYGLTDGEQLERLWSYLRPFSKITKEQTPGHRKCLLIMALLHYAKTKVCRIEYILDERLIKAERMKGTAAAAIDTIFDGYKENLSEMEKKDLISSMKIEETKYLENIKQNVTNVPHTWKYIYGRELSVYYALQSQIQNNPLGEDGEGLIELVSSLNKCDATLKAIERKKAITRWQQDNRQYQEIMATINNDKKKRLLLKLRNLCAERDFLVELRRKYSDGQTVATRISKRIKDAYRKIDNNIAMYNRASTCGHGQYPQSISKTDINATSALFKALDEQLFEGPSPTTPPNIRRSILDNAAIVDRAEEEVILLRNEMKNVYEHFSQLHASLVQSKLEYETASDQFRLGLHSMIVWRIILLEIRLKWMRDMFLLRGVEVPGIQYIMGAYHTQLPRQIVEEPDIPEEGDEAVDNESDYESLEDIELEECEIDFDI